MDFLSLTKTRRSNRKFQPAIPSAASIKKILEAGRWAPSGLNNQPWRFMIIKDETRKSGLAAFTNCGKIIQSAPLVIAVFLDIKACYNRDKDLMAIGACIQNMLLEARQLGLGTCWLGEILKRKREVVRFLRVKKSLELMALIAVGFADEKDISSSRKSLKGLLVKEVPPSPKS